MNSVNKILYSYRRIFLYAILLAGLIFILKMLQWKFLILDNSIEIYIGLIAVFFTLLGIWVATQLIKPKIETVLVEKEVYVTAANEPGINLAELEKLNLSNREYEVLQLLARGHSNADISRTLFLSVSTVKTHVSNLLVKMDVRNRTQATEKANRLKIIP